MKYNSCNKKVFFFPDIKFNNGRVKNQETIDLKVKGKLLYSLYLVTFVKNPYFVFIIL